MDRIEASQRVITALDCSAERARELAEMLEGHAAWVKIGMTLFYAEGPDIVSEFKRRGFKVFLDLKLHDIPHQVEGAAKSAVLTGADMLTVHACGGAEMMKAAMEGARQAVDQMPGNAKMPYILAVTVLTSMDDATLHSIGVDVEAARQVERLARLAADAGVSGVVASPQEAEMLKDVLGPQKLIVTPGIRPKGSDAGDQSRITTPAQAFRNGSTHIVIGRPITQSPDPLAAFESIVDEIAAGIA